MALGWVVRGDEGVDLQESLDLIKDVSKMFAGYFGFYGQPTAAIEATISVIERSIVSPK